MESSEQIIINHFKIQIKYEQVKCGLYLMLTRKSIKQIMESSKQIINTHFKIQIKYEQVKCDCIG
jgi:predicted lipoprotein